MRDGTEQKIGARGKNSVTHHSVFGTLGVRETNLDSRVNKIGENTAHMKIKKAKNLKEINICLYAFFGVLLILAIRSAFSCEKWDCAVLGLLMLFLLFRLINLEWEVNCAGITCYILFGKIKVKTYLWSNFCYVGSLLVLGKGRTLTSEMIVCAENKPYKKFSNSIAYALHGHYLSFENNEENRKIFSPYFTGQL